MAKSDVVLVSPDGKQQRKVTPGSAEEVNLRWNGYLPADQQKAKAPRVQADATPKTVGTNAV